MNFGISNFYEKATSLEYQISKLEYKLNLIQNFDSSINKIVGFLELLNNYNEILTSLKETQVINFQQFHNGFNKEDTDDISKSTVFSVENNSFSLSMKQNQILEKFTTKVSKFVLGITSDYEIMEKETFEKFCNVYKLYFIIMIALQYMNIIQENESLLEQVVVLIELGLEFLRKLKRNDIDSLHETGMNTSVKRDFLGNEINSGDNNPKSTLIDSISLALETLMMFQLTNCNYTDRILSLIIQSLEFTEYPKLMFVSWKFIPKLFTLHQNSLEKKNVLQSILTENSKLIEKNSDTASSIVAKYIGFVACAKSGNLNAIIDPVENSFGYYCNLCDSLQNIRKETKTMSLESRANVNKYSLTHKKVNRNTFKTSLYCDSWLQSLGDWLGYWKLLLDNQKPSTRTLFMKSIHRFVKHAPSEESSLQASPFGHGALHFLLSGMQELRKASILVIDAYIQTQASDSEHVIAQRQETKLELLNFVYMHKDDPKYSEFDGEGLVDLCGLLVKRSNESESCYGPAMVILADIAMDSNQNMESLLQENIKLVSGPISTCLENRPELISALVSSMGYSSDANDFIKHNIEEILPYLIIRGNLNTIEQISLMINEKVPALCIKTAHSVLASIFLLDDDKMQSSLQTYLNLLTNKKSFQQKTVSSDSIEKQSTGNSSLEGSQVQNQTPPTEINVASLLRSCSVQLVFALVFAVGDSSELISKRAQSALYMVIQTIFGSGNSLVTNNSSSQGHDEFNMTVQDVFTQINTQSRLQQQRVEMRNTQMRVGSSQAYPNGNIEHNTYIAGDPRAFNDTQIKNFTQRCLLGVLACINELFETNTSSLELYNEKNERTIYKQHKALLSLRFLFQTIGKHTKRYLSAIVSTLSVPLKNINTAAEALETYMELVNTLKFANLSVTSINSLLVPLLELVLSLKENNFSSESKNTEKSKENIHIWEKVNDCVTTILWHNQKELINGFDKLSPIPNFPGLNGARSVYTKIFRSGLNKKNNFVNQPSKDNSILIEIDPSSSNSQGSQNGNDLGFIDNEDSDQEFEQYLSKNIDNDIEYTKENKQLLWSITHDLELDDIVQVLLYLTKLVESGESIISISACLELENILKIQYLPSLISQIQAKNNLDINDNAKTDPISRNSSNTSNSISLHSGIKHLTRGKLSTWKSGILPPTNTKLLSKDNRDVLENSSRKKSIPNGQIKESEAPNLNANENIEVLAETLFNGIMVSVLSAASKHGQNNKHAHLICNKLLGLLGFCNEKMLGKSANSPDDIDIKNPQITAAKWMQVKEDLGVFNLFVKPEILDFTCYLILKHLTPLFISAQSPYKQLCLAYSIQELLKISGFSVVIPQTKLAKSTENGSAQTPKNKRKNGLGSHKQPRNKVSKGKSGYQEEMIIFMDNDGMESFHSGFSSENLVEIWEKFPDYIIEAISPLLESKYRIDLSFLNYFTDPTTSSEPPSSIESQTLENTKSSNNSDSEGSNNHIPKTSTINQSIQTPKQNVLNSIIEKTASFEEWAISWLIKLVNKMPNNVTGKIFHECLGAAVESPIELTIALLNQAVIYLAHHHHFFEQLGNIHLLSSFLFTSFDTLQQNSIPKEPHEIISIDENQNPFKCTNENVFFLVISEMRAVLDPNRQLRMSFSDKSRSMKTVFSMLDIFRDYIQYSPLPPLIVTKQSGNSEVIIVGVAPVTEPATSSRGKSSASSKSALKISRSSTTTLANPLTPLGCNQILAHLVYGSVIPLEKMALSAIVCGEYKRALLYLEKLSKKVHTTSFDKPLVIKLCLLVYILTNDIDGILGCSATLRQKGIDPSQIFVDSNLLENIEFKDSLDPFLLVQSQLKLDSSVVSRALDMGNWTNALHKHEAKLHLEPEKIDAQVGWIDCQQHMGQWEISYITALSWLNKKLDEPDTNSKQKLKDACAASAWRLGRWEILGSSEDNILDDSNNNHELLYPKNSKRTAYNPLLLSGENDSVKGGGKGMALERILKPLEKSSKPNSFDQHLLFALYLVQKCVEISPSAENQHIFSTLMYEIRKTLDLCRLNIFTFNSATETRLFLHNNSQGLLDNVDGANLTSTNAKSLVQLHLLADIEEMLCFIEKYYESKFQNPKDHDFENSEISKNHEKAMLKIQEKLENSWLDKIRAARLGNDSSVALSTMVQSNIYISVLGKNSTSKFSNLKNSKKKLEQNPLSHLLKIEKARILYEHGPTSQKVQAINEMQSVMDTILSYLVLNEKIFDRNSLNESSFIKACKTTTSPVSVSILFPQISDPLNVISGIGNGNPQIPLRILNSIVLNLSTDDLDILKKSVKKLDQNEISEFQSAFLDAGLQLLEWLGETKMVSSTNLLKEFETILSSQDSLKGHVMLGKQYNRLLAEFLESSTPEQQRSKAKFVATLRGQLIFHYSKACVRSSQYLYQAMATMFTVWFQFGVMLTDSSISSIQDVCLRFEKANRIMNNLASRIPPYNKALEFYPQQALWQLMAVSRSTYSARQKKCSDILSSAQKNPRIQKNSEFNNILVQSLSLTEGLLKLCNHNPGRSSKVLSMTKDFQDLYNIGSNYPLIVPIQSSMIPSYQLLQQPNIPINNNQKNYTSQYNRGVIPSGRSRIAESGRNSSIPMSSQSEFSNTFNDLSSQPVPLPSYQPFPHEIPMIVEFADEVLVMSSLQKPKKISMIGSDGKTYSFLCKPKDDLRKDSRLMEFNALINQALFDDPEAQKRSLKIKTYGVVPLNEECGLIEWVNHTVSIQQVALGFYRESGNPINLNTLRALLNSKPKSGGEFFVENILKKYPPVLYKWFMKNFSTPEAWLLSRNTFARSAAVMSMVGFVIGLGDRHCENILLHEPTGQVLHVDFNCLFERGTKLEVPEKVPFRLTHNMVDAMGVCGYEGDFRSACKITIRLLRYHRGSLMSILESFIHDPLVEWTNQSSRNKNGKKDLTTENVDKALGIIKRKLEGHFDNAQLSVSGQVDGLIKEATNPSLLFRMYIGWAAYI
ncbi:hypothetical protein BB558_004057 [Smittium angustum]|uniref:Serine/threonine-protein kinase ATR n=1 Tax=Smittium angustum TaxID=133377 RepID=A0A2U1J4C9_SMIAN|nr:hypothetical protein BB558_004057 [Smittium angustum]